jgi:hypothetical protein
MTQTAHEKYEDDVSNGVWRAFDASQPTASAVAKAQMAVMRRQMNGVIAERDALAAAVAAKTEQVAGLLDERQVLRARIAELEEASNAQSG